MTRFVLALAPLLFPALASATIFLQRPLQQEIQETPTIVRGQIGASYSDWGSDGSSKRIYTYYRLQLSETLKGDAGTGTVLIRELGGEKDGIGMQVAGAAHFLSGEDVVVFLGPKNDDGSYDVHGLSSGKFNLTRRADGADCLRGIALAEPEADGFVHPDENESSGTGGAGQCSWTLAALRDAIRDQGDAPSAAASTVAPAPMRSVLPQPAATASPNPPMSAPQEAPRLQPSVPEEHESSRRGRLWLIVLAVGLAGLGLLLLKSGG